MPKYLLQGSYSSGGVQGLVKDGGGTSRVKAVKELLKSVGGKLESFYFTFGDTDYCIVVDLPDNTAAAALGLTVGGSGAVANKTTVLLTPEEIDEAVTKNPHYRPPGK